MKICSKCAAQNSNEAKFCRACGESILGVPPASGPNTAPASPPHRAAAPEDPPPNPQSQNAVPDDIQRRLSGSGSMLWGSLAVVGMVAVGAFCWLLGRSQPAPPVPVPTNTPVPVVVNVPTSPPPTNPPPQAPPPAVAVTAAPTQADIDTVRSRYFDWLSAWQNMNIDAYMSYYSFNLTQKRAKKRAYGFAKQRSEMLKNWQKQSYITIVSKDPSIWISGQDIMVEAYQEYDSTTWQDKGIKKLTWRRDNGSWKIVQERFTRTEGGKK